MMSGSGVFIAAGFADIAPVVIAVVVALLSVLAQFLRNAKPEGKPPMGQPQQQPRPQGNDVDDEITEFLRRAAERRGAPPKAPATVRPLPAPDEAPIEAVILDRPVGSGIGGSRSTFEPLAERRRSEDAGDAAARTKEMFGRELGSFGDRREPTSLLPTLEGPSETYTGRSPIIGMFALLSEPNGIRQAIILGEILNRHHDRW
jgi:hypothetical protein